VMVSSWKITAATPGAWCAASTGTSLSSIGFLRNAPGSVGVVGERL
jgi:hypothetical protein